MFDLPFGFGGMSPQSSGSGNDSQKKRKLPRDYMQRMIQYGMQNNGVRGGGMGAVMGFMGLPFWTRQWGGKGSSGPLTQINPWDALGYGYGYGMNGGGGGGGGGDDGGGDDGGGGNGDGNGDGINDALNLLYPPPIGTGAQWRNTMKYGA